MGRAEVNNGAWPLPDWNSSTENILSESNMQRSEKNVSGAGTQYKSAGRSRNLKLLWIVIALVALVLAAVGATIGALIAKHVIHVGSKSAQNSGSSELANAGSTASSTTNQPTAASGSATASSSSTPTACSTSKDIPSAAKGSWTDVTSWMDMTDFNCTFTDVLVGGLPIVGLNMTYDNSKQANPNVPALNQSWGSYTSRPFRGVNIGGWLSPEPFITPSLFELVPGAVDEYTLCTKLGPDAAKTALEKHYSTFITEADFKNIAAAGLDHVRIPYSYWAVVIYPGDPYVQGVSWRYLLRGIEWARKYGLRVNLDLHAAPGSQNGWNHSGRLGTINWISGPDGAANAQRTLDIHKQLSTFFAQERYANIVALYGLLNEPAGSIPMDALISWTQQAYTIVRASGVNATQIFSEAMRGLPSWTGQLQGYGTGLLLDVHEYTLFDDALIGLKHVDRVNYACKTYQNSMSTSMNTATGFGPTMTGEWSQADTDCAPWLNGVDMGARWVGNFSDGTTGPHCPTANSQCSCVEPNADPSTFSSDYKQFLLTFAESQMTAFEAGWGWFYWTWKTEAAPMWSYQAALQGGFMPPLAYQRSWDCSKAIPSFGSLPEYY